MEIIIVLISSKNTENNRSPVTPNIKHKYQYWKKAHKYIGFCKKKGNQRNGLYANRICFTNKKDS